MQLDQQSKDFIIIMGSTKDGLSCAQATTGANVPSGGKKSTRDKSTVVCHRCKELGHFSYECPTEIPKSGTNHLNIGNLTLNDVASDEDSYETMVLRSHSIRKIGTSNVHQVHQYYLTTNLLLMYSSTQICFQTSDHH